MRVFINRVYILGLLFVLVGGLNAFIGFRHLEGELRTEIEHSISSKLNHIMGELSWDLLNVERALNAADVVIGLGSTPDALVQYFNEILMNNNAFLAMYLGFPSAEALYANRYFAWDSPVDPTTRPWYQGAVREGNLVFTGPYIDAAQGSWVLTMAKPVYDLAGELVGVVGIDKSLEGMLSMLEAGKPSERGYSLAFNQQGERLGYPGEDIGQAGDSIISEQFVEELLAEPSGMISANVDGQEGYLRWQKVGNSGIILATFAPVNDFIDGRELFLNVALLSVLTLGGVWLILLLFQGRYIIKPIRELDRDIMAISLDEDIAYRLPDCQETPFADLRDAINRCLSKAQEHYEHVVFQQEELSAAYAQLVAHEQQLQSQYNEIKEQASQIRYLAEHDALTGLLNRERFEQDLEKSLASGGSGYVVLLDIDDFKKINDIQGHVYGDRVLCQVAQTLEDTLPPGFVPYRFGGDEFLVLVEGSVESGDVAEQIGNMMFFFCEDKLVGASRKGLTISSGIVSFPEDGDSVDELLSKADLALHDAKQKGKNRVRFFEGSIETTFAQRVHVESLLRGAVESGGFELLYQPVVNATTGEVAYFEALLRLAGQSISPSIFISIAEETDLIHPIGRWVIREAISQLSRWQKTGEQVKPVAINLSAKQFYDEGLVEFLAQQFVQEDVDPGLLEMEITETVMIDNPQQAIRIIERMKALGIKMALDDFGTGYIAISYITNIPVDRIKLDQNMTRGLVDNIEVIEGLITMAHGLEMEVVAEGVETPEEATMLEKVNCDYLQGYLFSKPTTAERAAVLQSQNFKDSW
ncbi:MAG: EAL domain-containing protein [Firmicutes bacterium]|nr:EAL domain-containing protein [Bacillota bacterium]